MARAAARGHAVTLPLDARHYWLVAPSSWSMLVDAGQLLAAGDIAADIGTLTLAVDGEALALRQGGPAWGPCCPSPNPWARPASLS